MDRDQTARIAELEEALARAKERATRESERATQESERATREKERADNAEARQAPSRFLEYIQNAEEELYSVFYKESDPDKLSSGGINSPNGKYYPLRLRVWADFETEHARLFDCLDEVFKDQALFPSLTDVRGIRRDMSPDGAADELDLRAFIRTSIERPATNIIKEYLQIRPHSTIQSIAFKNNAYGLMPTDDTPREPSSTSEPPSKRSSPTKRIGIPDRWGHACHNDEFQSRTPLFVGEYKAAHKLTPRMLHGVLSTPVSEAFFTQALETEGETATNAGAAASAPKPQRVPGTVAVAHVLCQAFHYMITSGLEFGYVASGDGLIFLRVYDHDPKTLHYFVTIFPTPSMRDHEARRVAIRGMRTPRQTAVAYLCTFCLQTLNTQARPGDWISDAEAILAQWPIPYEGLARPIASRPPRLQLPKDKDDDDAPEDGGGMGQSHQPRLSTPAPSHSAQKHSRSDSEKQRAPAESSTTHTIFMGPYVVEPPRRPYCTQACLRGLVRGMPLDTKCPNVELHRASQAKPAVPRTKRMFHPIDIHQLRDRLVRQLDKHLEKDCECLDKYGYFGRFGVLFKITLSGFGYTFVAKGVQAVHRDVLEREVSVYRALETVQGRLIPVLLGVIDLARPFPLHSCARIPQMMLLAWAGHDLTDHPRRPRGIDLELEMQKTEEELAKMGLRNDDVREANLTWNGEAGRVMHIDFDQACLIFPQPLPQISRKRRFTETA